MLPQTQKLIDWLTKNNDVYRFISGSIPEQNIPFSSITFFFCEKINQEEEEDEKKSWRIHNPCSPVAGIQTTDICTLSEYHSSFLPQYPSDYLIAFFSLTLLTYCFIDQCNFFNNLSGNYTSSFPTYEKDYAAWKIWVLCRINLCYGVFVRLNERSG